MRKVIKGRTYNTETSKQVGSHSHSNRSDFHFYAEKLYKNTKGAYFLYGEGGPMSKYAESAGQNSWGGGSQLIPMTTTEAQTWAEERLDAEEYEAEFGVQEEAASSDLATRERVGMTIDIELMKRLREYSRETGIPMSRMLDKAIIRILDMDSAK